jgi:hypothetical protein
MSIPRIWEGAVRSHFRLIFTAAFALATVAGLQFAGSAEAVVDRGSGMGPAIDPRQYLASIYYDGRDNEDRYGERAFPILGDNDNLINTSIAYAGWNDTSRPGGQGDNEPVPEQKQNDPPVNVEDNSEIYIPGQITPVASGYPWEQVAANLVDHQILSEYPNYQRPAVYLHRVVLTSTREVWQYWLYYAVNPTSHQFYPAHEHDWESYWIYLEKDSTGKSQPVGVYLSAHNDPHYLPWSAFEGRIEDGTHLVLSCEGSDPGRDKGKLGSHAFYAPIEDRWDDLASLKTQDGVYISWRGAILRRDGILASGDGRQYPWIIVSNDGNTLRDRWFIAKHTEFYFRGDYEMQRHNKFAHGIGTSLWKIAVEADVRELAETAGDMKPPWKRPEWTNPPWWTGSGGGSV